MTAPSFDGLMPRSEALIAFSIAFIAPLSYGVDDEQHGVGDAEPGQLLQRTSLP